MITFHKQHVPMKSRDSYLIDSRPRIPNAIVNVTMTKDEQFQNGTLRPIIKFQAPLFIAVFKNYIAKGKNTFYNLSADKKLAFIENAVQKDMKFRNGLKGIVIGQFTLAEYEVYIQNSSALNKRMMNITKGILISNVQLFEEEITYKNLSNNADKKT